MRTLHFIATHLLLTAYMLAGSTTLATHVWIHAVQQSVASMQQTAWIAAVPLQPGRRFSVTALTSASQVQELQALALELQVVDLELQLVANALPLTDQTGGVDQILAMPSACQATAAAQVDGVATPLLTATLTCVPEAHPHHLLLQRQRSVALARAPHVQAATTVTSATFCSL